MEKAQNMSLRRMLDKVAWELRQYQGEEGNVESCNYEVETPIILRFYTIIYFQVQNFYKQIFFNPGMNE